MNRLFAILLCGLSFSGLAQNHKSANGTATSSDPVFNKLVWSDECNGTGPVDTSKWFHQTKLPIPGSWYNGELQHYTSRLENSSQYNGAMRIFAKRENFTDQGHTKSFTSARLNSKFAFKYGRVEVRAKLPTGAGTWPAIWMLGKNIIEDGAYWTNQGFGSVYWPACGEIDIMEHWGSNQNYVSSAVHTPSSFGGTVNYASRFLSTASTAFHVYALVWTKDYLEFSIDSLVYYTYNPALKNPSTWPFNEEQYLLLNVAIEPSVNASFTSSYMEVDYVRVYQESGLDIHDHSVNDQLNIYPNPVMDVVTLDVSRAKGEELRIEILSNAGELVLARDFKVFEGQVKLDNLELIPRGIYIIRCISKQFQLQDVFVKN